MTLDPKIAQRFRNFHLVRLLGQGGMSSVYLARNEQSGEEVAIKFLHPYLAHQQSCRQRFFAEAHIIARLQHPYIVKVLDFSAEDEKELFIITEFIPGKTLHDFAHEHQLHRCPELAAMIIARIAETLAYAHEQGIIHRDIKPENIMVRDDGMLKLMDFGIARVTDTASITLTGTLLGSPAYMAPELIEGKELSHRSDVFSLAAVFYWLATGATPFAGDSPHALLRSIMDADYVPPAEQSARILPSLAKTVDNGLARDVNKRCASARGFAQDIVCALREVEVEGYYEQLELLLLSPQKNIAAINAAVRKRCLKDARIALRQNHLMHAMPLLNRVLAENSDDEEAQSLLNSLSLSHGHASQRLKDMAVMATALLPLLMVLDYVPKHIDAEEQTIEEVCKHYEQQADVEPVIEKAVVVEKIKEVPFKVTITPFADVYVDGQLVKKNAQEFSGQLSPGRHSFKFKHAYAQMVEKIVEITSSQSKYEMQVNLEKVKPAMLIVNAPLDADIAVNGVYKGTMKKSGNYPIVIALPDKKPQMKYEVIVSKKGYRPYVESHVFVAGMSKEIAVNLQPLG